MPPLYAVKMKEGLHFRYSHMAAAAAPSKQTATQRKGREKDAEAAENAQVPKQRHWRWRRPGFVEQQTDGTAYGNAMHGCMQHLKYESCGDATSVANEVRRLTEEGFLTPEQAQLVDCGRIAAFFESEIGKKLCDAENVLREFKFSILDDGVNYDPALEGEQILLQGVVDCAILEDDGITVVDFKTDRVFSEEEIHSRAEVYRPQLEAYSIALEQVLEKKVVRRVLYFLPAGKAKEV